MRVQANVTDLSAEQMNFLDRHLQTDYNLGSTEARVCAVFESGEIERHVQMPPVMFAGTLALLNRVKTAQAVLTPDALPDELRKIRDQADPAVRLGLLRR